MKMTIQGDISEGITVHEGKIINRITRHWLRAHQALLMKAVDFLFLTSGTDLAYASSIDEPAEELRAGS